MNSKEQFKYWRKRILLTAWITYSTSMMESSNHNKDDVGEARRVMTKLGGKIVVTPYYPMICSTEIKKKIIREG